MTGPDAANPRAPWFVWVLTAAFILLVAMWASVTLSLRAPDETAHFSSSFRMSEGFSWPAPGEARMPGAVVAAAAEVDDPQEGRSSLNELNAAHPGVVEERGDQMTQHPPTYYVIMGAILSIPGVKDLPWGQALFLLRLTGALFAAPVVWLAWSTVLTLTRSRRTAAVAAFLPFAVPQFAQTFGTLTNDSIAMLMAWVVTWLAVRVWRGDRRISTLAWLGASFGVAALTKGTALPLGILLPLVLLFAPGPSRWSRRVLDTVWPLALAAAIGGWWWVRNLLLFGSVQPSGLRPFLETETWAPGEGPSIFTYISELWRVTVTTFWGWFGRVNAPLPEPLVETLTVLCVALVVIGAFRYRRDLPTVLVLAAPVLVMVALFLRTSWSAYAETTVPRGLHGRYFFTVLLIFIALAAIAARNVVRDPGPRRVLAVVLGAGTAIFVPSAVAVALVGLWADFRLSSLPGAFRTWIASSPMVSELDLALLLGLAVCFVAGLAGAVVFAVRGPRARRDQTEEENVIAR